MKDEQMTRAKVLLQATRDLLSKQKESYIVLDMLEQTVHYDGADCDGNCLLDDIDNLLSDIQAEEDFIL